MPSCERQIISVNRREVKQAGYLATLPISRDSRCCYTYLHSTILKTLHHTLASYKYFTEPSSKRRFYLRCPQKSRIIDKSITPLMLLIISCSLSLTHIGICQSAKIISCFLMPCLPVVRMTNILRYHTPSKLFPGDSLK